MNIIAFDLGSNMAWAFRVGARIGTGTALYTGTRPERLAGIYRDVCNILSGARPKFDVVIYETPFARGLHATRSLWGIAGVIELAAMNNKMVVLDVSVATIKKFAVGRGDAPKNAMVAAARKFGYRGANEHEADACCLLKYAEANLERTPHH